jgi:acetyl-CoA/propionyl-CoA carboxylase biotin carboxyl carrier protein
VVVVSTRDCSLQRRHQKLVEEAPAPFLSSEQERQLRESSKAILREAGYVGAGTCEFLIGQDGLVSFLEVNTRLQVEHPVTEEVSGVDLVREMFLIADGQPLSAEDPELRGHSIEFRINAEDPGRKFLPAPGTISSWRLPSGPGVRLDAGYTAGMTVPQQFDSLIAKLIITGASRQQALERSRRALAEFEISGMPTVLPFHRAVVADPAFTSEPFSVHTRWIETEFAGDLPPWQRDGQDHAAAAAAREQITVEVGGKRIEVVLPAGLGWLGADAASATPRAPTGPRAAGQGTAGPGTAGPGTAGPGTAGPGTAQQGAAAQAGARPGRGGSGRPGRRAAGQGGGAGDEELTSPMQGTIVSIVAEEGQRVAAGDTVVVLEAMKMEQPLTAHRDGTVTGLAVQVGQTVPAGEVICQLRD